MKYFQSGTPSLALAIFSLVVAQPTWTWAELQPKELAILANSQSPASMAVAEHYAKRRGLSKKQIIALPLPSTETISRLEYDESLVGPLRAALEERKLSASVEALVTTFDVPLRVARPEARGEEKQFALDAISKRRLARAAIHQAAQFASGLGTETEVKPEGEPPAEEEDTALLQRMEKTLANAAHRVSSLEDTEARGEATNQLSGLIQRIGGFSGLIVALKPGNTDAAGRAKDMLTQLSTQVERGKGMIRQLDQFQTATNRTRAYVLTERVFGVGGVLIRAAKEIERYKYDAADASLDSELSLLWWDRDMYPLSGRLPNPLHYSVPAQSTQQSTIPVLMVSRLDGPTVEHAKHLVDLALKAEAEGLKGRVYMDARGLKRKDNDTFALFDQDLRDFGWLVRKETDYKVTIDNHQPVLDKAREVALYSGWYSVRKFQGNFEFVPGALGYHIASYEAVSVRNPEETGWCKNLLERGITATLGAVEEPYLESFPLPQEFFGLLMTGEYSLVEAYYVSTKYLSWRLVLFGDPLYNPWRRKGALRIEDLELKSGRSKKLEQLPLAPSLREFADPVKIRSAFAAKRKEVQGKIDTFFAQATRDAKKQKK